MTILYWTDEFGKNQVCSFYRVENAVALYLKLFEDCCQNLRMVTVEK